MFYEDVRVGQSAALGQAKFSREAILAYGRRFDPRVVAEAAEGRAPLTASGLHVAAAGMRQLVDARRALRAAMLERGETLPQLGVSPGLKGMRWPYPVHEGDIVSYSMETASKRETSKPKWGLVGNRFRGVNQRGQEVLVFSSVVLMTGRRQVTVAIRPGPDFQMKLAT
jgi:acyl dehydratase